MITVASSPETHTKKETESIDQPSTEPIIFRSRLPPLPYLHNEQPLHRYCFANLAAVADRPCIISSSTGRVFSYAETHRICLKTAAAFFTRFSIARHSRIMILLPNAPEFVFTFMAASYLGAATTAANPFFTPAEILKQFRASGAKLILTAADFVDKVKDLLDEGVPIVTVDTPPPGCVSFWECVDGADEELVPNDTDINPNDPVALPFSSGTTGLPKGVLLTHKSLISSVSQQIEGENPNMYVTEEDVVLCVLPMFHIFSLNSVMLCSLRAGAAVMIMPKFEISTMLAAIERYKVSIAMVVPPLVLAMAKSPLVEKYDLSSIRMVQSGAAPLGKDLEDALRRRLPQAIFGQGYGMTEAGPVLCLCPAFAKQPVPAKSGSCGTVVRNAELKFIDPDTGVSLGRNQPGEICIRGPQIMSGYLNDAQSTAATIDVDGWLHTGDIGYVDDDDEVFIVDRAKELIKFKGFQVPPAELEALLLTHPSISDAAVVPQQDVAAGELPVAFVVRNADSDIKEEEVKEFISKQVVFYKRLHKVYFTSTIPKSPSGKILRKDLKAKLLLASSSSPTDHATPAAATSAHSSA